MLDELDEHHWWFEVLSLINGALVELGCKKKTVPLHIKGRILHSIQSSYQHLADFTSAYYQQADSRSSLIKHKMHILCVHTTLTMRAHSSENVIWVIGFSPVCLHPLFVAVWLVLDHLKCFLMPECLQGRTDMSAATL